MAEQQTRKSVLEIVVNNSDALKAISEYQDEINKTKNVVNSYKDAQKDLDKAYREGKVDTKAYKDEKARLSDAINREVETQKALQTQMRQVQYQMQKNIQQQTENEGSLKSLRGELSQLNAQYDSLSRADRNGAVGDKLLSQIAMVRNELGQAEADTGRFQRNVGNYTNQMVTGFRATAGAGKSVLPALANMKTGVIALKTAGGWVGLVVGILARIIQSMKGSETAMNSVRMAMVPLTAVGKLLNNLLQKMGEFIGKVVERLSKFSEKLKGLSDAMKTEQELTKSEIALNERRRKILVENAQSEQDIATWKAQAAEKDKRSATERIKLWEKIGEEEKKVARREKELADEELRIAEGRSKQTANSAEDNDKLAQARARAIQAETEYQNKVREVNAQLAKARKEEAKTSDEQVKADTKADDAIAKNAEAEFKRRLDIEAQEIEARLSLVEKGSEEELELQKEKLRVQHEKDLDALSQQEGTEELRLLKKQQYDAAVLKLDEDFNAEQDRLLTEETDKILAEAQARFDAEQDIERQRVEMKRASATAIAGTLGNISSAMDAFAEQDSALAKASKVIALAKIAIETGVATAEGIAQSQSVPFPANIAAIATTIGSIAAGMASAVSAVKSAKFAKGGLVVGEGSATSDSIPARLSNGESVMTARATTMFAPLLSSMNQMGGGNAIETPSNGGTAILEQAIARGMQAANVSVSVREIDTVRERMDNINAVANV